MPAGQRACRDRRQRASERRRPPLTTRSAWSLTLELDDNDNIEAIVYRAGPWVRASARAVMPPHPLAAELWRAPPLHPAVIAVLCVLLITLVYCRANGLAFWEPAAEPTSGL